MCKISVVLPVYNGQDYLEKSIQSVLTQTMDDYELIIVNDCSEDRTKDIAIRYAEQDHRIKIINNEKNLKLPASLNIGFETAKGKYWTWTSHDNMYLPDAFKIMCEELDKDTEIGMVYCDYYNIDAEDNIKNQMYTDEPENIITSNVVGACFLYRKEIAKKIGNYDTEMFLTEDYDYWLRISKSARLKRIRQFQYCYRKHEKSLTETKEEAIRHQQAKLWLKHVDYITSKITNFRKLGIFYDKICEYSKDKENVRAMLCESDKRYKRYCILKKLRIC